MSFLWLVSIATTISGCAAIPVYVMDKKGMPRSGELLPFGILTWTRLLTITNCLRSRPVLFSTPEQFLIPLDISDRQNGSGILACRRRFAFWAASRSCSGMERIFGTETIRSSQEFRASGSLQQLFRLERAAFSHSTSCYHSANGLF